MLKVGDLAPDFEVLDCRGEPFRLSAYRGKKRVVLFFFPRAFSLACTTEVRHFRDNYDRIVEHNAELVGISVDRHQRNCQFAIKEELQFRLIGDEDRSISEKYGVVWPVLHIDRRATFVIDENGVIEDAIHHEIQVYKHLDDVLTRLGQKPL